MADNSLGNQITRNQPGNNKKDQDIDCNVEKKDDKHIISEEGQTLQNIAEEVIKILYFFTKNMY